MVVHTDVDVVVDVDVERWRRAAAVGLLLGLESKERSAAVSVMLFRPLARSCVTLCHPYRR